MWCHLLLLVPVAGLGLFFVLPWPAALGVNALLTGLALGIAVPGLRALRQPVTTGREALVGRAAEATSDIRDGGLVRAQGELWTAKAAGLPIVEGAPVRIVAVRGSMLIVESN